MITGGHIFDPFQPYEEPFDPQQRKEDKPPYVVCEPEDAFDDTFPDKDVIDIKTEDPGNIIRSSPPVIPSPLIPRSRLKIEHKYKVLQSWEGTLVEISGDVCRAIVQDSSLINNIEEITFSIEEISESDRELAVPGAIFYWYIGYEDHIDGQRNRVSTIKFRRIPAWSKNELKNAKVRAMILLTRFKRNMLKPAVTKVRGKALQIRIKDSLVKSSGE